jgi:hypothetical protein
MGTRYIEVPAESLMGRLRSIGELVEGKGGGYAEGVQGREVVVDIRPAHRVAFLRIYTTLTRGAGQVRACGDDAIRLVVGHTWIGEDGKERFGPLAKSRKLLRTAPKGPEMQRISAFLDRFTEALRGGYRNALCHPTCPKCGRPMRLREPKRGQTFQPFYGCTDYPGCRGSRPA